MKKFTIAGLSIIVGVFIDRILYHLIYLPKIGKTFALHIELNDLVAFYKWPASWVGLFFISLGLILFMFRD